MGNSGAGRVPSYHKRGSVDGAKAVRRKCQLHKPSIKLEACRKAKVRNNRIRIGCCRPIALNLLIQKTSTIESQTI